MLKIEVLDIRDTGETTLPSPRPHSMDGYYLIVERESNKF